jgi:hypothetical protein
MPLPLPLSTLMTGVVSFVRHATDALDERS